MDRSFRAPWITAAARIMTLAIAAGCTAPVPPGALTPIAHRHTNEARAVDLHVFDAWAERVGTLMAHADGGGADRERLRAVAAADAWLAFARDEYVRLPASPVVDETFARARAAIVALETGTVADGRTHFVVGTERRHDALWAEYARLSENPHADPGLLGETAVLLVRAGRVPVPGDTVPCDPEPFLARVRQNLDVLVATATPGRGPRRPPVRSVYFAFDSDTIPLPGRRMLDELAERLDGHAGVSVVLEGLTDPRGTEAYNTGLAHRRAVAIQQYLAARTLAVTAFEVRSLGPARREADLRDLVGLARDRRVDLRVFLADGREAARGEALDDELQVERASPTPVTAPVHPTALPRP